jgi:hypothetical protein
MRAIIGLLVSSLALANLSWAQEDPVLSLLVRKGLVTQKEADTATAEQRDEAEKQPTSAIVLKNPSVQKLEFYGDGRLRFEDLNQHNHSIATTITQRERYRLRFGADYYYSDHFKAGLELESGTADDSANQTFGSSFTKASINVGRIYLQYQPVDELTLIAGKFANPWYTTSDMVYSFDLNPEGTAELFNYSFPLGGGSGTMKQAQDDQASLTIAFNAVQYLYLNNNESTSPVNFNNNDVFIIGNQIPITWKVNKDLLFKVAPGFTFYTSGGNTDFDSGVPTNTSSTTTGATPGSSTVFFGTGNSTIDPVFYSPREADDLAVFSAPGEINFAIGNVPFRPYWDFEYNTEAGQRIQNVYLQNSYLQSGFGTGVTPAAAAQNKDLTDGIAWSAGLQIGANKKKGDWSVLGEFRQIGLGAVDQNINGTDFADSYANQQGFKFSGAYNFTDFFTATLTYFDTWDYKSGLYQSLGGGTSTNAMTSSTLNLVSEKSSQRLQFDLGWKF